MRPPVLPSGNPWRARRCRRCRWCCFNEAAGFTQRKRARPAGTPRIVHRRFNEAAGFTQRKHRQLWPAVRRRPDTASMRPPVLPSGNWRLVRRRRNAHRYSFNEAAGFTQRKPHHASSRTSSSSSRFNEAAGFTQRKPYPAGQRPCGARGASMRPPVLPSGNLRCGP